MFLMDVDIIMNISLHHRRHDDLWAWHYECKGFFSMRSTYRMLIFIKEKMKAWLEGKPSNSNVGAEEKQWCLLWNTHVPSKIKMFLWLLAKQSLPRNDVHHHQRMVENDRCVLCGAADSWRHALIYCTMPHYVWALINQEVTKHMCGTDEGNA
jgi:hypothetical protein